MSILDSVTKKKATKAAAPKAVKEKKEAIAATAEIASHVLIAPVVSEKSVMAEVSGIYTFRIQKGATKVDVASEIKRVYGVTPVSVRVVNVEGKIKRFGRSAGRRASWKKAVVTVPSGASIAIHSGV